MGQSSQIGSLSAAQQTQQQQALQKAVNQIQGDFSGFTPQFYAQRGQDYVNYEAPQLASQEQQTNQAVDYKLGNQGIANSSAAQKLKGNLGKEYALQQTALENQGTQQAQQLQQQVQGQENNLISEAETATNPGQVAQQGLATASQFQAPSMFAPLGDAFTNFKNTYLANAYSNALTPFLSAISNNATASPALSY